jgi:hypothetical protein
LARRAGIDPWFLAYFEQSSDTTLTGGALFRVAVALDDHPSPSRAGWWTGRRAWAAGAHPTLEHLTTEQCEEHLGRRHRAHRPLHRLGPVAFPVNFIFAGGAVIFRTSDAMADDITGVVAFEVDHIDEAMSEGWSVLVRGHARLIEEPAERLAVARSTSSPGPAALAST